MLESRKSQLIVTIASNLVLQIITALCGFILPPLIVETFGSSVNGMVSSITQFIAYLNLVEAGIGGAAIAALYFPLSENNHNTLNGILSATRKFYNKSGILFSFLIILLAFLYPVFIGTQVDYYSAFLMVLILGISSTIEFFFIGKYTVLLTADKKVYVISIVQSVSVIANTIVAVIAIKLGAGILFVKFLSALVYLSRFFILLFYVHKKYKWLNFNVEPDVNSVSQSKNVLIHQLTGLVVFNSPIIILTIFCSLKDVSVYSVYAMVFNAISMLLNAFSSGMQSFFGESLVKENIEKSRKFFLRYKIFYTLAECWFYSMSYMLIMPFMSIYTKNMSDANYYQPVLGALFVIVGFLNNFRWPEVQLINAAGHFKKTQNRAIIELCINLFFSIICTLSFGFVGVLIGSLISYLYRCTDMIIYCSHKILKYNTFKLIISTFSLILLYGVLIFILSLFSLNCNNYIEWIQIALLYGVVFAMPIIICFLFVRRKI